MELFFEVKSEKVTVGLREAGEEKDSVVLDDPRALSRTLLPAVDDLLTRHGLRPEDVSVAVSSEVPPTYTSYRIAETTARMLRKSA